MDSYTFFSFSADPSPFAMLPLYFTWFVEEKKKSRICVALPVKSIIEILGKTSNSICRAELSIVYSKETMEPYTKEKTKWSRAVR